MPLGDFLVAYLQKLGVTHCFGIPGDLVLRLFLRFGAKRGLRVVTLSHEPGVGFAADGYARATGRLGVVCVTYGAGGHNMVNAVAGSFSERVPLLVVSGGPGDEERKLGTLIHHQAKEVESQLRIYRELTCDAALLDDPRTAAETVHRVVQRMWQEQRPGYLEVHRDMVERRIPVPPEVLAWDGALHFPRSDEARVAEAVRETAERLRKAKRPVVTVGIEAYRYGLAREVTALAEHIGAPVATTSLSKGAFPEDHPLYMGVFVGGISPAPVLRRMQRADLTLNLGAMRTDIEEGARPMVMRREQCAVAAVDGRVEVSLHTYERVQIRDFVRGLLRARLPRRRERVRYADSLPPRPGPPDAPLVVADLLVEVNRFLAGRRDHVVVADSGDMLFGALDVRVARGSYLAQGFYASMGFAVPGALGAQLGGGARPLVLVGDGAFQMTGIELSHAPRHGLNPIVVVVNNGGWQIFRPVVARTDLLDLPSWPYAEMARGWGGHGVRVRTRRQLRAALADAGARATFVVIEACVAADDHSPLSRKYIQASARKGAGAVRRPARRTHGGRA